jgi:hypothetical protein
MKAQRHVLLPDEFDYLNAMYDEISVKPTGISRATSGVDGGAVSYGIKLVPIVCLKILATVLGTQ